MSDTVNEFFEGLPSRVDAAKTAGMNNSYVFDIDGAGTWTVKVDDGSVTVDEGDAGGDCTISASAETFEKIVDGRAEPDDRLHVRQAEDQGRHGRRDEAAEALLSDEQRLPEGLEPTPRARRGRRRRRPGRPRRRGRFARRAS